MYTLNPNGRLSRYLTMFGGSRHGLPTDGCSIFWLAMGKTALLLIWVAVAIALTYTLGLGAYETFQFAMHGTEVSFAAIVFLTSLSLVAALGLMLAFKAGLEYQQYRQTVAYFTRHPEHMDSWWSPIESWTWTNIPYGAIRMARHLAYEERKEARIAKNDGKDEPPVIVAKVFSFIEVIADVWNAVRQKACVKVEWVTPEEQAERLNPKPRRRNRKEAP